METTLNDIASAMHTCRHSESVMPNIETEWRGEKRKRRPYLSDMLVHNFPQTWGTTTLGFGGIGGQAFQTANTTIVICGEWAAIFFGGRYAYTVKISSKLMEDISNQCVSEVALKGRYKEASTTTTV